jgi:hypothetical protein
VAKNTQQVAFRFPEKLLKELDAYVAQLNDERPGADFTRADAVRMILTETLARKLKLAQGKEPEPQRARGKRIRRG